MTAPEPIAARAEERRIMDFYAPTYRRHTLTNSYSYQEERRLFVAWILERLRAAGRDPERLSYLDVGCGPGNLGELLHEAGCASVTGLDLSLEMLRQTPPGETRLVQGTVEEPPFAAGSFDVLLAAFTVHHLADPRAFFRLVDQALAPGGWFFLLEYSGNAWSVASPMRPVLGTLVSPLRAFFKLKNRTVLRALPPMPALFNPAHRLLRFEELRAAIPPSTRFRLVREAHGFWLPFFNHALVGESAFDRVFYRGLRRFDRAFRAVAPGHFQWIAGERLEA